MTYYLVEYDRKLQRATLTDFADPKPALEELRVRERDRRPEVEVVLLMADSVDQLKRTHSRYFFSAGELLDMLRDALSIPA